MIKMRTLGKLFFLFVFILVAAISIANAQTKLKPKSVQETINKQQKDIQIEIPAEDSKAYTKNPQEYLENVLKEKGQIVNKLNVTSSKTKSMGKPPTISSRPSVFAVTVCRCDSWCKNKDGSWYCCGNWVCSEE